jgi:predicted DNA-binding transcriptional regulator YafY
MAIAPARLGKTRRKKAPAPRDDARYGRLGDLLELCVALQGSALGLTLDDVAERYGVGRRTATRMLQALQAALGVDAFDHPVGPGAHKRWRLRHRVTAELVDFGADDLAALDVAAEQAARDGRDGDAASLRATLEKLRALLRRDVASRLEPDVEALIEAQGFATRPGPRPRVERALVEQLRQALLACRKLRLLYRGEARQRAHGYTIWPLGLLYGTWHYLVAWNEARGKPVLFRLSRIERAELLDERFEPPEAFDLRAFAERSFGVFQEDPVDVVWRFRPAAAAEAREHVFHPRQETETQADGSLLVRFRAGGLREMAWHLFTWGGDVEVVAPAVLRTELDRLLAASLGASRARVRRVRRPALRKPNVSE